MLNDNKKLNELRTQINEVLWTGKAINYEGLVSLKDILKSEDKADSVDEYVILYNAVSCEDDTDPISKDRHVVVNRTKFDFNKKSCKLVTFTDITVYQKLKIQEEKSRVLEHLTTAIQDGIISPLNFTQDLIEELPY